MPAPGHVTMGARCRRKIAIVCSQTAGGAAKFAVLRKKIKGLLSQNGDR